MSSKTRFRLGRDRASTFPIGFARPEYKSLNGSVTPIVGCSLLICWVRYETRVSVRMSTV